MKVFYIATECKPFSAAGGVASVAGELPFFLKALGIDVEVVIPEYGCTKLSSKDAEGNNRITDITPARTVEVRLNGKVKPAEITKCKLREKNLLMRDGSKQDIEFPVTLIGSPEFFGKKGEDPKQNSYAGVYVNSGVLNHPPFYDDALRFSFFSEACFELVRQNSEAIIHGNDWPSAYLFGRMATNKLPNKRVLTIHNIGYQGNMQKENVPGSTIWELSQDSLTKDKFQDPSRPNDINAMRLAMELSDITTAVSPSYAEEITQPEDEKRYFEGGKGLHEVAARLKKEGRLVGILNGLKYGTMPSEEALQETLRKKEEEKRNLAKQAEFSNPDGMLIGFVGRAVSQKLRLLKEHIDGKPVLERLLDIPKTNTNFAFLCTGQQEYHELLQEYSRKYGKKCFVSLKYDPELARQINFASDYIQMFSDSEPCGIVQFEAFSRATPVLANRVGGLSDTIDASRGLLSIGKDAKTGEEVLRSIVETTNQAVNAYYKQPNAFRQMQKNAFNARFPWDDAAKKYIETYKKL